ncbi:MAG: V-type ATP synthase subunit D [Candidatus Omnitrophica bacterium CG1_02_49_10]|nr:MAG: V-type ATP synthase subunit D [Candidatus Omnitrophica bacterium CG1_02_49_10]
MAKIKLTKNALKQQKDELKRYRRYLPTLLLKKQQLQLEILRIERAIEDFETKISGFRESVDKWAAVFAEDVDIAGLIKIAGISVTEGNIAGIDIPIFKDMEFEEKEYNLETTSLWVDYGIDAVKEMARLKANLKVSLKQLELIKEELRITTQRVNLFEKVKIPEAAENIRVIRIFLGDMQTASVVTGKIAKNKIELKAKAAA